MEDHHKPVADHDDGAPQFLHERAELLQGLDLTACRDACPDLWRFLRGENRVASSNIYRWLVSQGNAERMVVLQGRFPGLVPTLYIASADDFDRLLPQLRCNLVVAIPTVKMAELMPHVGKGMVKSLTYAIERQHASLEDIHLLISQLVGIEGVQLTAVDVACVCEDAAKAARLYAQTFTAIADSKLQIQATVIRLPLLSVMDDPATQLALTHLVTRPQFQSLTIELGYPADALAIGQCIDKAPGPLSLTKLLLACRSGEVADAPAGVDMREQFRALTRMFGKPRPGLRLEALQIMPTQDDLDSIENFSAREIMEIFYPNTTLLRCGFTGQKAWSSFRTCLLNACLERNTIFNLEKRRNAAALGLARRVDFGADPNRPRRLPDDVAAVLAGHLGELIDDRQRTAAEFALTCKFVADAVDVAVEGKHPTSKPADFVFWRALSLHFADKNTWVLKPMVKGFELFHEYLLEHPAGHGAPVPPEVVLWTVARAALNRTLRLLTGRPTPADPRAADPQAAAVQAWLDQKWIFDMVDDNEPDRVVTGEEALLDHLCDFIHRRFVLVPGASTEPAVVASYFRDVCWRQMEEKYCKLMDLPFPLPHGLIASMNAATGH